MSLIGYIRDLDRKFAWSFLGVLLALLFGGVTIYGEFFADSSPRLRYDILTSTPVLDVREDVSKLSIIFDDIDIREQNKSLRVITVRVVNDSRSDILKTYYDDAEPLGLRLSTGRIIRSDLVAASNPYLERQLVPHQPDDTLLAFPSVILESKEYFVVKLLVLHDEEARPEIVPVGKIAGVRTIPVFEAYKQEAPAPFLRRAFGSGAAIHAARLLAYTAGMIILIFAVFAPVTYISEMLAARNASLLHEEEESALRRGRHIQQTKTPH